MTDKLVINRLSTGVPGLDTLLGGGLPEFSFNLIAGSPGSGKTTLSHQIMFSLANLGYKALFFTVLGEPTIKMLRYQQQFSFFDVDKLESCIRFVNLSSEILNGDFSEVMKRIKQEVQEYQPRLVFVDSFRSIVRATQKETGQKGLEEFMQQLGMEMTSWQATTFLIGEYQLQEAESSPVFTVADGIIWMSQHMIQNSQMRKIQIVKIRGQAPRLGLHTYGISDDGLRIYPRTSIDPLSSPDKSRHPLTRLSMGVEKLDDMLDGGLPVGYSMLLVGPPGVGKTTFAAKFLEEGAKNGEQGIVATFEKNASIMLNQTMHKLIDEKKVDLLNTLSLDITLDEILYGLIDLIKKTNAKRVVIDSLSGFEVGLSPEFRENYHESVYRMISTVTGMGVTILLTSELEDSYGDLRFSQYGNAFLADSLVILRYVEMDSKLARLIGVVKIRGSNHSKEIRSFEIQGDDIIVGKPLTGYQGLLSGRPVKTAD
jgi:circadian clock protein KaiC